MNDNKILIRETLDGEQIGLSTVSVGGEATIERAAVRPKRRKATASATKLKADPYIWGIYLSLLIVSVVELFSASSSEVVASNVYAPLVRHGIFLALGFVMVLWMQNLRYKTFSHNAWTLAILSLGLLIYSSVAGIEINGAQRAISIAGFTIQPAEIVKLVVVLLLSKILGENQEPGGVTNKGVIIAAVVVLVFSGCLWRNGLTNTLLLMSVSLVMFLIGGVPLKKLGVVFLFYGVAAGALFMTKYVSDSGKSDAQEFEQVGLVEQMPAEDTKGNIDRTGTQKSRVMRFIKGVDPDDPINDYNRQVIMARFAQANGGLVGQGPGNSRESSRLPLAFSDYIYSIIVEDTGFVGGVILAILYLWLLARAGTIAYKCRRALPAFLIMGCAVLIVLQALGHMAIVTGIAPVSGQPLPLISKGGTSILVMSAAIGVMLSVSRHAATASNHDREKEELAELPDDLQASNFAAGAHDTK